MLFFKESSCPLDMISSPQLFRCRFFRMYLSIHNLLVSGEWWESCGKLPDDLTIICTISKILGVPWTCLVFDKYISTYWPGVWNCHFEDLEKQHQHKKVFGWRQCPRWWGRLNGEDISDIKMKDICISSIEIKAWYKKFIYSVSCLFLIIFFYTSPPPPLPLFGIKTKKNQHGLKSL